MQALARGWEAFWLERSIEPGRLAALRVGFFGLLGADLVHLMVAKAYRYGAAGFNVPHFDSWGALLPIPDAAVHTVLYLVAGFLAFRVAAGIAVRVSLVLLTLIYGYAYFSSLLDSYQHHYMVFWFLLLSWLVPFHRVKGVEFQEAPAARVPAWGLSLFYAQMSLVYFFTAVAKLDANWRDGWVLQTLPMPLWIDNFAAEAGAALHYSTDQVFSVFAYTVLIWEFIAAVAFVYPRLRVFCCITGPIFHVMVELINLKVRWFSLYMLVLYYLLLFPDTWYHLTTRYLTRAAEVAQAVWAVLTRPRELSRGLRVALVVVGCAATFGLCATSVLPGGMWLAVGITIPLVWAEVQAKEGSLTFSRILVQIVIVGLVVGIPRFSNTGYEYYRLKGGDLTLRGELEAAVPAYEKAIECKPGPDSRHAKLADVLYRLGRYDEAMPIFREALELDPEQTRALRGMVKGLEREGRYKEAQAYRKRLQEAEKNRAKRRRRR